MTTLQQIVLDFEAALLNGVRTGADEAGLTTIRDQAFDRLLEVKEGPGAPPLETIFDVAAEIGLKLSMALETIRS
ncbi:hypothetical protein [Bradyrhizobium ottawaense]|uniref:hypothetical protein n=1 Tax=Bradyrhizobium ottawaense TaxID=931866 RepID=UPI001BAA15F2|nr:hypothetical protein [Bradyrhizobium ottawaense]MBR1362916.1 hypothetical protein [Bradyrhizobium ottawaense]GMO21771.1 hypothetical protein BwSF12_13060 [Bradyrhizobium ottawaense]GMO92873.1 hypothetical protein BwSF19_72670 [Bradyrhizobium ottawaense]